MKKSLYAFVLSFLMITVSCSTQSEKSNKTNKDKEKEIKNVILLIGDGMGLSQLYAGYIASQQDLAITRAKYIGLQKTNSANDLITGSASSGTALSTGKKTNNKMIGMAPDSSVLTSILELAEKKGLATGLVSTSAITHATPAAFIAHQPSRYMYEEIAADFLKTDIDVFIGGGKKHFTQREDNKDLVVQLKEKDYQVISTQDSLQYIKKGKLAAFTANEHNPKYSEGRENMLPDATSKALDLLSQNKNGFFLMVEGSQIDWGGHDNDTEYIINEVLDFDRAVEKALAFAEKNKETLVIVTADHECGGMGINGGDLETNTVEAGYTSDGHTGVWVPVFAFGAGAEKFIGFYDNTELNHKMTRALNLN